MSQQNNNGRPRGVMLHKIDPKRVKNAEWEFDPWSNGNVFDYAIGVLPNGDLLVVHTEGVHWIVSKDGTHSFNAGYVRDEYEIRYTRDELLDILDLPMVDLADHIRTFGDRLEVNFFLAHSLFTD